MLNRFLSKELFYPLQLAESLVCGILKQVQNDKVTPTNNQQLTTIIQQLTTTNQQLHSSFLNDDDRPHDF